MGTCFTVLKQIPKFKYIGVLVANNLKGNIIYTTRFIVRKCLKSSMNDLRSQLVLRTNSEIQITYNDVKNEIRSSPLKINTNDTSHRITSYHIIQRGPSFVIVCLRIYM